MQRPVNESDASNASNLLGPPERLNIKMIELYVDSGPVTVVYIDLNNFFLTINADLVALINKDKDKEEEMNNPRPDFAFGIQRDRYQVPRSSLHLECSSLVTLSQ